MGTRPNLAYVVNSLNPGGTEKLVIEMSRAFAAEYDVRVICLDEPGAWAATLRQQGIDVHCVWRQPGLDLSMASKLAAIFRSARIDIIHAHQCTPWFYAALSRLFYRRPRLLLEEHGRFFPEVLNRRRVFVNRCLIRPLTHSFVAVSADIRSRLETYEGVDAGRIRVIYNGTAAPAPLPPAERAALRASFGFGPDDFVVGTVGRFDSIKNLPMLVEGLIQAGQRVPRLRGLLVGDGPEMGRIRSLVASGSMADRIRLTGFRSDAGKVTQCMDLFALSSFSEGTSMALLDAMAVGVPAVVTHVGGNPEIVENGRTGWTVPSGDAPALAKAIVDAANDEAQRRQWAAAAQSRYAENFTVGHMLESYRGLYRSLLGERLAHAVPAGST